MKRSARIFMFLASILVCQGAGVLGSVFTAPAIPTWYAGLKKPSFNPPDWVFAPVWTTLFLLMGISLYFVWSKETPGKSKKAAVAAFAIQLALNSLWSFLFFGLHVPLFGLLEIFVLWFFILLTLFLFYRLSRPAAFLLLPYLLWVSFATVLNYALFTLNR
jgi:benzodiazapine receptor